MPVKSFACYTGGTTKRSTYKGLLCYPGAPFPTIQHTILDLTLDASNLYAVGAQSYGSYYKAAISKISLSGDNITTATYEPVADSKGYWIAVCVNGQFVYVAGTIIYSSENYYRAVIQKLNISDLSLVWEYKFPLQAYNCEMRDIDIDTTDVYGVKESYTGTAIERVRVAITDGSEVWRLGPTTLGGIGIICNVNKVYLTKGYKTIEDITKSTGAETDRLYNFEPGNFARGVISGSDLYLCGYYYHAGLWNPSIHKIDTLTWTQTWKYTDALTNITYYNCIKDDNGVYALSYESSSTVLGIDLSGNLIWKKTALSGYSAWCGITQLGDYLYIGINKSGMGVVQKRLKTTGELTS
jgi:hypothetical protein